MPDYEKLYHTLFNHVTDAIETLQEAQRLTEELYTTADELRVVETLRPEHKNEA